MMCSGTTLTGPLEQLEGLEQQMWGGSIERDKTSVLVHKSRFFWQRPHPPQVQSWHSGDPSTSTRIKIHAADAVTMLATSLHIYRAWAERRGAMILGQPNRLRSYCLQVQPVTCRQHPPVFLLLNWGIFYKFL